MSSQYTDREQWAEIEAKQFDKFEEAQRQNARDYITRGLDETSTCMAHQCTIMADTWKIAAQQLRKPYYARLEREYRETWKND
jgi:hypothetical protein